MQGIPPRRHATGMKTLLMLAVLLPVSAWAEEAADRFAADRSAIDKVVAALNDPSAAPSSVWAPGVDGKSERAKLSTGGPMSEVFSGRISIRSILFLTRKVAMVDATQAQFGSLLVSRTVPLVLTMKKVRTG